MSFIEKIRQQPQPVKIRVMWIVSIVVAVLLILVWIISGKFHKNTAKDFSLFKAIGRGVKDVRDSYNKQ